MGCSRSTFQTRTSSTRSRVPAASVLPVRAHACYSYVMLTFASDAHRHHHPREPFHDRDGLTIPPEVPERAERIRAAIDAAGFPSEPATAHGIDPVLRVHTRPYVDFLEHAHQRWRELMDAP